MPLIWETLPGIAAQDECLPESFASHIYRAKIRFHHPDKLARAEQLLNPHIDFNRLWGKVDLGAAIGT